MEFYIEERNEALRQIRFEGHRAQRIKGNDDSILVLRMDEHKPVTGEWEKISVLFYDSWLDGANVPKDLSEAMGDGK